MATAKNADQTCEARYYSGNVQLGLKDPVSAQKEFTAARDECPKTFREYHAAVVELKRLPSH